MGPIDLQKPTALEQQADEWRRLRDLFEAMMAEPPDARAAMLDSIGGDTALKQGVRQLLWGADEGEKEAFLAEPAVFGGQIFSVDLEEAMMGRHFGPYRIVRPIAHGGMGVVYLAERDDEVYHKQVAIKFVQGMHSAELLGRFQLEREILARLEHPHIARLLDGGASEEGWPYLVMEYVDGTPITGYCRAHQLSIAERLRLFNQICGAVQYAHKNLIVHRDLKPGNILVSADGVPKLLDFGIAKMMSGPFPNSSATLTTAGLQPMSPLHASPEQIRGEVITTASDVYSLGVLLYELLTGLTPYRLDSYSTLKVVQAVCEQDPLRPSLGIGIHPPAPADFGEETAGKLRRRLQGDLDNVVMLALRKEAEQRYQSVEQLRQDIRWHLEGRPVFARHSAFGYRMKKLVRRNWGKAIAAAALLLSLVGGVIGSTWQARRANENAERYRRLLYAAQMREAMVAFDAGNPARARDLLEANRAQAGETDLRGFEWNHLWALTHPDAALLAEEVEVNAIAISPDGEWLAAGLRTGAVGLWDVAARRKLQDLKGHAGPVWAVAFSRDRRWLASGGDDRAIHLHDVATWQARRMLANPDNGVRSLAFSPDGSLLAAGGSEGGLDFWEVAEGRLSARIPAHSGRIGALAFSPDGKRLVTTSVDQQIKVWDVARKRLLALLAKEDYPLQALAFSPDGQTLATGSTDPLPRRWDLRRKEMLHAYQGLQGGVRALAFSPDGETLATGNDSRIALFDSIGGRRLATLTGHSSEITSVVYSSDGQMLATASTDRTIRLWDVSRPLQLPDLRAHTDTVWSLAFSPDGRTLATAGDDFHLRLWNAADGRDTGSLDLPSNKFRAVAFAPGGRTLATGHRDGTVRIWDLAALREPVVLRGHAEQVRWVAFSPDGQMLASASEDQTVKLWSTESGTELQTLQPGLDRARSVAFSPDGRFLAMSGDNGLVKIREPRTGRDFAVLRGHADSVYALAFSPDGRELASSSSDQTVKIWDVAGKRERITLKGHTSKVWCVAFSPDGNRLATAGGDNVAKIWDAGTGHELITIKGNGEPLRAIAFSPDGAKLAMSGDNGLVKLWHAAKTGEGIR